MPKHIPTQKPTAREVGEYHMLKFMLTQAPPAEQEQLARATQEARTAFNSLFAKVGPEMGMMAIGFVAAEYGAGELEDTTKMPLFDGTPA